MSGKVKVPFDLESQIIRRPEYWVRLRDTAPGVRLHVSRAGGGLVGSAYSEWKWALLLRAVSGWAVIAGDVLTSTDALVTHGQFASVIADKYGDGFAEIPREECCAARSRAVACIYGPDGVTSYCGVSVKHPAVFDRSKPGHVTQHCIECNQAYRAANYGKCPITH